MESPQVEHSILTVTRAIGTDIAYLENDDMAHFDHISTVAGVAVLLLTSFFDGLRDATKDGGKRAGGFLTEKLAQVFSSKKPPDSSQVVAAAKGVQASDLERYGDVAQSLMVKVLVENGLPLRKAESHAGTVRTEADRIVTHHNLPVASSRPLSSK